MRNPFNTGWLLEARVQWRNLQLPAASVLRRHELAHTSLGLLDLARTGFQSRREEGVWAHAWHVSGQFQSSTSARFVGS